MKTEITELPKAEDGWQFMLQLNLLELKKLLATEDTIDLLVGAKVLPGYNGTEMEWFSEGHGATEEISFLTKERERAEKLVRDIELFVTLNEKKLESKREEAKVRKARLQAAMELLETLNDEMHFLGFSAYEREFTKPEESIGDELEKLDWV